ncbi:MAG TPA: 4Fe-4S dicluster domain-containing protein [Anaerolineales bacterium]|nr:4Fe-4S dicluster domain-containing protein [Anaerolineales bacterium]
MSANLTFADEISNLLSAADGNPLCTCIQCGTCSGTCPVAGYMDHTPRKLIAMILAGLKDQVLASNTFWFCASCYHCTVRCPQGINITEMMYALKRYSIWKSKYKEGLIGPVFSETFVKTIFKSGRSYEPVLAPTYIFSYGVIEFLQEAQTATSLMLKGRLPLLPPRIKRLENFRRMIGRIIPVGGLS